MPPFVPLPRFILWGEYSINAKLLYALLLGRTQLSQKSGWVSEDGDVYVIYTIRQMANDLNRSERTVKTALAELENAGLIIRVRQGWNRANRIFLQLPDEVQLSSRPEGKLYFHGELVRNWCGVWESTFGKRGSSRQTIKNL